MSQTPRSGFCVPRIPRERHGAELVWSWHVIMPRSHRAATLGDIGLASDLLLGCQIMPKSYCGVENYDFSAA